MEIRDLPVWMIDHHPNPDDGFEIAISVETASSTCELIYQLFKEHNPDQISGMNPGRCTQALLRIPVPCSLKVSLLRRSALQPICWREEAFVLTKWRSGSFPIALSARCIF